MIHQCFYRADQRDALFSAPPYCGFGLEPEINDTLLSICPELADKRTRVALVEYAAMLFHWRRKDADPDAWIGFTSYRQLSKTAFIFDSKRAVELALADADVASWGVWDVSRVRSAWLTGAAAQANLASPSLHKFTVDVLSHFGLGIPQAYFAGKQIIFANYWVMSRQNFDRYMSWSWPIVQHAHTLDHPYKCAVPVHARIDQRKAVGYLAERLFAMWVLREGLRVAALGDVTVM